MTERCNISRVRPGNYHENTESDFADCLPECVHAARSNPISGSARHSPAIELHPCCFERECCVSRNRDVDLLWKIVHRHT